MSLTLGSGPFSRARRGTLNVDLDAVAPAHVLLLDPVDKRVRLVVDGTVVVDTRRAAMLHESQLLPRWYVPRDDVAFGLLEPTDTSTHCPFKGDASYWTLRVGDVELVDVAWGYPEPLPDAPDGLADLVCLDFAPTDEVGTWYEEDQPVVGHPRDPYHRVDTRESSDEVVVLVHGREVARTSAPVKLFETGLPPRWYLPRGAVAPGVLRTSATTTRCPYKGTARHHRLSVDGVDVADAAWYYPDPLPEAGQVANLLCFLGDGVQTLVDGEPAPGT